MEPQRPAKDDRVFTSRYVYKLKRSWIQAEEKEWQCLWEKGVFKKGSRKDLLSNDRVFTSRYVYKLKRSAITGEVYCFKARLIVRGFQVEKGVDFDDSFSPTPGLAVGRFMLSRAVANDYELHACDIEQAFKASKPTSYQKA
jgi:hypothetical protein